MSPLTEGKIASIRQKLLNLCKERNEDFQFILTKYGIERFLYRISKSEYRNRFVLKGALSLTDEFASNNQKQIQWKAFLNKNRLDEFSLDLLEIVGRIRTFLHEPLTAAAQRTDFNRNWEREGSWK